MKNNSKYDTCIRIHTKFQYNLDYHISHQLPTDFIILNRSFIDRIVELIFQIMRKFYAGLQFYFGATAAIVGALCYHSIKMLIKSN